MKNLMYYCIQNNLSIAHNLEFLKLLKNISYKKGIVVDRVENTQCNNSNYIKIIIFIKTNKFIKIKNKLKKKRSVLKQTKLSLLFNKYNIVSSANNIHTTIIFLNNVQDFSLMQHLYSINKRFISTLFLRRYNLFIDLVKITSLLIINKYSTENYLILLGEIFKGLSKNKHGQYTTFIKILFDDLVKASTGNILGISLRVSGKIKGKSMASELKILAGTMPLKSIKKNITFYKVHVYTFYGVYGLKLWIYKK
jgi:hypothetical protein